MPDWTIILVAYLPRIMKSIVKYTTKIAGNVHLQKET